MNSIFAPAASTYIIREKSKRIDLELTGDIWTRMFFYGQQDTFSQIALEARDRIQEELRLRMLFKRDTFLDRFLRKDNPELQSRILPNIAAFIVSATGSEVELVEDGSSCHVVCTFNKERVTVKVDTSLTEAAGDVIQIAPGGAGAAALAQRLGDFYVALETPPQFNQSMDTPS